jgi:hypothetical protein
MCGSDDGARLSADKTGARLSAEKADGIVESLVKGPVAGGLDESAGVGERDRPTSSGPTMHLWSCRRHHSCHRFHCDQAARFLAAGFNASAVQP